MSLNSEGTLTVVMATMLLLRLLMIVVVKNVIPCVHDMVRVMGYLELCDDIYVYIYATKKAY